MCDALLAVLQNRDKSNSFLYCGNKIADISWKLTCCYSNMPTWLCLCAIRPPPAPPVIPRGLINCCAELLPLPHNHPDTRPHTHTHSTLISTLPLTAHMATHTTETNKTWLPKTELSASSQRLISDAPFSISILLSELPFICICQV